MSIASGCQRKTRRMVTIQLRGCTTGLLLAVYCRTQCQIFQQTGLRYEARWHSGTMLQHEGTHIMYHFLLKSLGEAFNFSQAMLTLFPPDITLPQWSAPVGDLVHRRCTILHILKLVCLHWSVQLRVREVAANTAMINRDLLRNEMSLSGVHLASFEDLDLSRFRTHTFLRPACRENVFRMSAVPMSDSLRSTVETSCRSKCTWVSPSCPTVEEVVPSL